MVPSLYDRARSRLLHARTEIVRSIFGAIYPTIVRVSINRAIKSSCDQAELEALRFVAKHTSVPVPKVYRTYAYKGRLYIELQYFRGQTLEFAWTELSADQKRAIAEELAGFVGQLRALEPPQAQLVASAESNGCVDYRIGYKAVGPFLSHEEFHSYLRGGVPIDRCEDMFGKQVAELHSRQYRTCFSHADLATRNIIVNNGKIVAIIDWAFSGWYPEYWEYTKAHYGMMNVPDWYSEFERVMPRYDDELKAECSLWTQYEEPGNQADWAVGTE